MIAVADDALCTARGDCLAVGAGIVFIGDSDMTAAAETRDLFIFRRTQETSLRAHGHNRIGWVATMTIVTGYPVLRVHAGFPISNRRTEMARQATMTLETNGLISQNDGGKSQPEQAQDQD